MRSKSAKAQDFQTRIAASATLDDLNLILDQMLDEPIGELPQLTPAEMQALARLAERKRKQLHAAIMRSIRGH